MNKKKLYVLVLTVSVFILTLFGILMSFSISSAITEGFSLELFYRQLSYVLFGAICFVIFSSVNHVKLKRFSKITFLINFILIILVLVLDRNGSRRWIQLPNLPFSFQPSQYAFISLSLMIARLTVDPIEDKKKKKFYTAIFLIVLATSALVIIEPDMGSGLQIFITGFALLFVCGMPLSITFSFAGLSLSGGLLMLGTNSEWRNRILAYFDPYKYESLDAMQSLQALRALARGGISGVGFMRSLLKFPGGLPVSSSDFVYAIIGEEFGMFTCLIILFLFVLIAYFGFRISREARSAFSRSLAFGLTFGIVLWALINMAVNVVLIPTTGVPLSFISFGGNNLIANFIALGIVINIARKEVEE